MTLSDKPRIKDSVRLRNEKFGKLIVAAGLPMLCINHDAVLIVDMLNGQKTIGDIVDTVSQSYPSISRERISESVMSFLERLLQLSILE